MTRGEYVTFFHSPRVLSTWLLLVVFVGVASAQVVEFVNVIRIHAPDWFPHTWLWPAIRIGAGVAVWWKLDRQGIHSGRVKNLRRIMNLHWLGGFGVHTILGMIEVV